MHCVFHGHHIHHFFKCIAVEKSPGSKVPQELGLYRKQSSKNQILCWRQCKVQNMQKKTLEETFFLFEGFYFPFPWCGGHQNLWLSVYPELES